MCQPDGTLSTARERLAGHDLLQVAAAESLGRAGNLTTSENGRLLFSSHCFAEGALDATNKLALLFPSRLTGSELPLQASCHSRGHNLQLTAANTTAGLARNLVAIEVVLHCNETDLFALIELS